MRLDGGIVLSGQDSLDLQGGMPLTMFDHGVFLARCLIRPLPIDDALD
jgi:hypothetical protein